MAQSGEEQATVSDCGAKRPCEASHLVAYTYIASYHGQPGSFLNHHDLRTRKIQTLKQILAEWEKGEAGEFKPAPEGGDTENNMEDQEGSKEKEDKEEEGLKKEEEGPPPSYYSEEELVVDEKGEVVAEVGWLQALERAWWFRGLGPRFWDYGFGRCSCSE